MSILHLGTPEDADRILQMLRNNRIEQALDVDEAQLEAALAPLLEGEPFGTVYLIGPRKSPVGYMVLSFGWSIPKGGITAKIEEFWIRKAVRNRGMGSEALTELARGLTRHKVRAVSLILPKDIATIEAFFGRQGFEIQPKQNEMVQILATSQQEL